ncbi:hypothetical protein BSKO_12830 [Bryopsis sp. KO-2023]|nr:hypothetical protein BSKO_12830 [Bryopsis sp. KO-2023]
MKVLACIVATAALFHTVIGAWRRRRNDVVQRDRDANHSQGTTDSGPQKVLVPSSPQGMMIGPVLQPPSLFEILGELYRQHSSEVVGHGVVRVVTCGLTGHHFRLKSYPNQGHDDLERDISMQLAPRTRHLLGALCCCMDRVTTYTLTSLPIGGSLSGFFPLGEAGDVDVCRIVGAQILSGLSSLHRFQIAHRALTLQTLHVDSSGNVCIGDFGDAIQGDSTGSSKSTQSCSLYWAPEVVRVGEGNVPADVWAFGVILHRILSGRFPFRDLTNPIFDLTDQLFLDLEWSAPPILCHSPVYDLFRQIFRARPADRPSVEEICCHSFFNGINWHNLGENNPLLSKVEGNKITLVPLENLHPRRRAINGPINKILFAEAQPCIDLLKDNGKKKNTD